MKKPDITCIVTGVIAFATLFMMMRIKLKCPAGASLLVSLVIAGVYTFLIAPHFVFSAKKAKSERMEGIIHDALGDRYDLWREAQEQKESEQNMSDIFGRDDM